MAFVQRLKWVPQNAQDLGCGRHGRHQASLATQEVVGQVSSQLSSRTANLVHEALSEQKGWLRLHNRHLPVIINCPWYLAVTDIHEQSHRNALKVGHSELDMVHVLLLILLRCFGGVHRRQFQLVDWPYLCLKSKHREAENSSFQWA